MDYISNLPRDIIETILCLLPIKEAARTSILSREWRYIWTKIPELVFDEDTFHVSVDGVDFSIPDQTFDQPSQRKRMDNNSKLFFAIFQVLFFHKCRIQEFTLSMKTDTADIGIDVILHHLSLKTTLKKLTLKCYPGYILPSSFFTLNQLTDLYLSGCEIDLMPPFTGFGRLTSFFLEKLTTTDKTIINFLSMSPLLKTVTINIDLDDIDYTGYSTITKLFECLPVIENLSLWYGFLQCFASEYELPQKLQTTLVHLKYFCVKDMCFAEDNYIHILVPLITISPNLEKLKLEIKPNCCPYEPNGCFTLEDYSDIRFEHLRELDIINMSNMKNGELDFVKLILAKSPVLKKVRLSFLNGVQILAIFQILSCFPRASSEVEVEWS